MFWLLLLSMAHMLLVPTAVCLQRKRVLSVSAALGRGMLILVQLHTHTHTEITHMIRDRLIIEVCEQTQ